MPKGDHIYVYTNGNLITHHGISCGDGTVIHYQKTAAGFRINRTSYKTFAKGSDVYIKKYPYIYSPDEIVRRAMRRIGETNYHVRYNNCEHFARYCTSGAPDSVLVTESIQVKNGEKALQAAGLAAAGLTAVETTVAAPGILGAIGLTTTVGLPVAAIVGGAALVGGALWGIGTILSNSDDTRYENR
ncbi:hypothetical protein NIES4102_23470 [Chondrocystis sp. NIES-4102]|nr:hypothetical protein NIES4102_23470 [Chondrocystis sp. NIES-4102]